MKLFTCPGHRMGVIPLLFLIFWGGGGINILQFPGLIPGTRFRGYTWGSGGGCRIPYVALEL